MRDPTCELAKVKSWAKACEPDVPLMIASTSTPKIVAELQARFGASEVAETIERFLASVAVALVDHLNVRRLVLAGGETSGAIVRELGVRSLHIGPEICAGVPWTETIDREPKLLLALKSGNFGGENFFAAALERLA